MLMWLVFGISQLPSVVEGPQRALEETSGVEKVVERLRVFPPKPFRERAGVSICVTLVRLHTRKEMRPSLR
jgi:hypothetical protein